MKEIRYENMVKKQLENAEKPKSKALEDAENVMGVEPARNLYDRIRSEEVANQILKRKSLLFGSGLESHKKEVEALGEKGLQLSKEYNDKKEKILNNPDLTSTGKGKQMEALYNDYNARVKAIIEEQRSKIHNHIEERSKIAEQTLETIEKEASIKDFTHADMQYIVYMLEHANNDFLMDMLEEYEFNPFLLKMINARESKKNIRNRLTIEHPLKAITRNRNTFIPDGLRTKIGQRRIDQLIPHNEVPSIDPWAKSRTVSNSTR